MGDQQNILDPEVLKTQDKLSDEQQDAIAKEALAEFDEEHKDEGDKKKELFPDSQNRQEDEEDEDETEEEKEAREAKETEEAEKAEAVEALKSRADKVGLDESATLEEIEAKETDANALQTKDEIEKGAKAYAVANDVPEEDARKVIEAEYSIANKYQKDPLKLARAYRSMQSEYDKTKAKMKELSSGEVVRDQLVVLKDGAILTPDGRQYSKDDIIDGYRETYPKQTADKDDDEVHEMAIRDVKVRAENEFKVLKEKQSVDAKTKRMKLLEESPVSDKKWVPEVKTMLENQFGDGQVLSEDFSVGDVFTYIKGKHYDEDVKAIKEEYFKKGMEQPKILGETVPIGSGSTKTNKKSMRKLSLKEDKRMHDMFDASPMTEDQMRTAFLEIYPKGMDIH